MRVLLVEDDYAVSQSIETMLKKEGMIIDTTDLGEDGLEIGKLYDYDIIILDLMLPDMNGYEVLKRLRSAKIETPVLILSGLTEPDKKVKGLGYGADDYLTKPFDRAELLARIQAVVRRSKGHANSVIRTGDVEVNLDTQTVSVNGETLHLTGKEYGIMELLSLRNGFDAQQRPVLKPSLRRHRRTGTENHRRVYLQTAQKAGKGLGRQKLHRNRLGARLCPA